MDRRSRLLHHLVAALALTLGHFGDAARAALIPVALTGQRAPDTPEGVRFGLFAEIPSISSTGRIAFKASLLQGSGGVDGSNANGIWAADASGTLRLVARASDAAEPGSPLRFSRLGLPEMSEAGVVFPAELAVGVGGVTSSNDTGIWKRLDAQSVQQVAREGNRPPGLPPSHAYYSLFEPSIDGRGNVGFQATTAFSAFQQYGVYGPSGDTSLTVLAHRLVPAPIEDGGTAVYSSFFDYWLNETGQSAFFGALQLGISGVDETNNLGLWITDGGSGRTLVARSGSPAPGTPDGTTYWSFPFSGRMDFNDRGTLAFGAWVSVDGSFDAENVGLWLADFESGARLALRSREPVPIHPGWEWNIFGDFQLNDADDLLFVGWERSIESSEQRSSLFVREHDGNIRLVASSGDDVAGGVLREITGIEFNDLGDVVFSAVIDGPQTLDPRGVFFARRGGAPQLVLSTDIPIEVAPGDARLPSRFGYDLSDTGQLVLSGMFRDGSSAVLLFTVPEASTAALLASGLALLARRRARLSP